MIITTLKDIRINQDQGMLLFKRSIISRDMLPRTGNFITINDCSFAFANRINKFADLEVKNNSNWIFINNNDENSLRKVFEQSDEIKEVEEKTEESIELEVETEEIIEPVENDQPSVEADYVFVVQDEEQSSDIQEPISIVTPESEEDQDEQLVVITPETEADTNDDESAIISATTQQQYRQIHVGKNKKKHHQK